ncbi:hypothetical protein LAZ40_03320 [Cereibacter sphaeroides]|uniref:hypothetical protein n=1 Tax=Cereibacter sphaeroides TaxID=1063 RepID=UPI001F2C05AC|nr:hypothetical protein [Cereibacter sphaeroides]MCE6958086.1 hypothetical protein [Cereibacter sphaeroides]MCE6971427.1 hypothetical protein [Cereibacter sphaeroides]
MLKTVKVMVVLLGLVAGAAGSEAADKPWEKARPAGMTAAHEGFARAARQVQDRLPAAEFGMDPRTVNWKDKSNLSIPVSNMTIPQLTTLLTGRYHVFQDVGRSIWSARYYAADGKTWFCEPNKQGKYEEWVFDRYVGQTAMGLAGIFHWDPTIQKTARPDLGWSYAWPMVANAQTGEVSVFRRVKNVFVAQPGWIQEDYAAAFAEKCPQLPRVSKVNQNQLGRTFKQLAGNAHPVRGFRTSFPNDPRKPLTGEMYYWLNVPLEGLWGGGAPRGAQKLN